MSIKKQEVTPGEIEQALDEQAEEERIMTELQNSERIKRAQRRVVKGFVEGGKKLDNALFDLADALTVTRKEIEEKKK